MSNNYGASQFASLLQSAVLWFTGDHVASLDYDCYPIIPSDVTVTNNGTFTKTDLGNNYSVLNFDGSTNYISLTDSTSWDIWDADFTICGWFKLPDTSGEKDILIQSDGTIANRVILYFANGSSGGLYFQGRTNSTDNFHYSFSTTPSAGVWMHLAYVRSGSATAIGYKNGVSKTVTTYQAWQNTTAISGALIIGNSTFKDSIKDLIIYKGRALSQPEIILLMNRTHPITGAGLLPSGRYYRLS